MNLPASIRGDDLGDGPFGELETLGEARAIEVLDFAVQGATGFIQDAGRNAAETLHVVGVEVDVKDRGREGRVMQGLEALTHVPDDLEDDLARSRWIGSGGSVHSEPDSDSSRRGRGRAGWVR